MIKTRGRKIIADVLARKGRTALVSLSIMVGVFGVALLVGVGDILISTLKNDMPAERIAQTKQFVVLPFGSVDAQTNLDMLQTMQDDSERLPGLERVEGQAVNAIGWKYADDPEDSRYRDGTLIAYTLPFDELELEPVSLREGRWPVSGQNEVAVDVRFADAHGVSEGDTLVFRPQQSGMEPLRYTVVGLVYQPFLIISPTIGNTVQMDTAIFATYEDAQAITGFGGLSAIYGRYTNYDAAESSTSAFTQYVSTEMPYIPVFIFQEDDQDIFIVGQVQAVVDVLNLLAIVAMIVSGFLVVNVINTIIVEQKGQIGVMKSLGASRLGVFSIYAGIALIYGVIGTVLGVLLAIPAMALMAQSIATVALTYIEGLEVSANGIVIGAVLGLLVPVLVAIIPVYNGTRVRIIDAMTDLGISSTYGQGRTARVIKSLPLPVSMRQAVSNVMQKQGRLLLTGITLMMAVAAFMGISAVQNTINDQLEDIFNAPYDLSAEMSTTLTLQEFEAAIAEVEGIEGIAPGYFVEIALEGYVSTDGLQVGTNKIPGVGLDIGNPISELTFADGGWDAFAPQDDVVDIALPEPVAAQLDVEPGDAAVVTINGVIREARVIGIVDDIDYLVYMDWRVLTTLMGFVDENGEPLPNRFLIDMTAERPSADEVADKIFDLEQTLLAQGVQASYINLPELAEVSAQQVGVFGFIFNITAGVMAVVGAIGLLATLSMAVFERQKEIGVMRSIGAGSFTIVAQFLTEGMFVGVIAWVVAIPLSVVLGDGLIQSLPFGDIPFEYAPVVAVLGLGLILIVTLIASIWPSLAAARKSVSEILRYQ